MNHLIKCYQDTEITLNSWCNADIYARLDVIRDKYGYELWRLTFYQLAVADDKIGGREMFTLSQTVQTSNISGDICIQHKIQIHRSYRKEPLSMFGMQHINNDGIIKILKSSVTIDDIVRELKNKIEIGNDVLSSVLLILMQIGDEQNNEEETSDMDVTFKELFDTIERNKIFNKMTKQSSCGSYSTYIIKGVDAIIIDIADDTTEEDGNVEVPMSIKYQGSDIIISAYRMTNSGNKISHMHTFECDHTKSVCEALEFILSEDVGNKCIREFDNMKKSILDLAI